MRKLFHLLPTLAVLAGCLSFLPGCPADIDPPDSTCGDGAVDTGEACDDGNNTDGDGCSATCTIEDTPGPECGDGALDAGEECDDGNATSGDGCSSTCTNEAGPKCGDGTKDSGEQCDDGNTDPGDGCDATCHAEPGPKCGDHVVDPGEQCDDGNMTPGDGCENNCYKTVVTTVCQTLQPLPNNETCSVTAGNAGRLLVGDVLVPGNVFKGGQVVVDAQGTILFVGCDYTTDIKCDTACQAAAMSATAITCPTGAISPALINTHDHITFTQNSPAPDTGERYEHRHDWRKGLNGHTKISPPGGASNNQQLWGELRFLFGGAVSTVGSGGVTGILRNLDKAFQEGLGQDIVEFDTFPLGDSSGTQLASGCGYGSVVSSTSIAGDDAYLPHVAEGINAFASNEFTCLSSANPGHDIVVDQSAFIHSIGLTPPDYASMAENGTSLIWSPRSNVSLYGDTAVVTEAARLGVLIALGTDWMPSGSMNVLRELQCADSLNTTYYANYFSDEELWMMTTANAAAATATDDVIGTLAPGKIADITIFNAAAHPAYRAVIDAKAEDVVLVMRAGKVLYGDGAVVAAVPNSGACDTVDVCGASKQVCLQGEIQQTYTELEAAAANIYAAFFCGLPTNEPTCKPSRPMAVMNSTVYTGDVTADDSDGDGVLDAADNCPTVFNPVRPLDGGMQADFDGDGVGDACDVCPLDANSTTCSVFDPNDSDGDGIPNATDKCPNNSDPNQEDADDDGKGDACDPCPMAPNPGAAACPKTIYEIKNGTVAEGSAVSLVNALVTARRATGFFLQVKPGDPGYTVPDFSGVFVYDPTNVVKAGDRVTLTTATVTHFPAANPVFQIQLVNPVIVINASLNEAPPPPVVALPSEVTTGGAKADALEGVIVQVANVTVTDVAPAAGPGDVAPINEFVVDGTLRVNDFLFLVTPFPAVNDGYQSITGVLQVKNGDWKLEPRSAADVVGGVAHLAGFGPALSFAAVGQTGAPTYPTPLTVSLSGAVGFDVDVTIDSGDPLSLTVVGGKVTIPAGQVSAPVLVDGIAQSLGVTLTATLGATSLMASVRVVDPSEQPVLASITPASATLAPGGMVTLTATLDIPAPVDTTVTLDLSPANAGTIPPTVVVLANQLSATFDYVDGSTVASATVTGTLGGSMQSASLTMLQLVGGLVINEVDYDQPGTDSNEFIEIYNGTGADVDLAAYTVYLVNGANAPVVYKTIALSSGGTLAAGQYLVLASPTVVVPAAAKKILFSGATDQVQNGTKDGIALVNTLTSTLVDALSYEGALGLVDLPGIPGANLVEGAALAANVADDNNAAPKSLCRLPNGGDTDQAAADWKISATPTPGEANVP